MKKYLLIILVISFSTNLFAKKVKFATDMTGQVLSPNGIHVTGDFQTIAGFPGGDWAANTTTLTQEGSTNIYSIIIDLPAFAKYEYKFVNGDQFYEAEFVPVESRVGYNFDDNRWIYVDSLAADTTFVGAILFAGNAPAGLTLVRFVVDMQTQIVASTGVHVAGNHQGWNPAQDILYSFVWGIYERIDYVTAGTYEYRFYNGNISGTEEIVPAICSVNSNREVQATADIVLPAICFAGCIACTPTLVSENLSTTTISLSPNPSADFTILKLNDNSLHSINITDVTGRMVRQYKNYSEAVLRIEKENLVAGLYFVNVINENKTTATAKLIFE